MKEKSAPPSTLQVRSASEERHDGPARTSPYPISRLAPAFSLVDAAKEIEGADVMVGAVVSNKLQVIVDQIQHLKEQAQEILEQASQDARLHRAEAAFKKRPGEIYHLYERSEERLYFSMLSPEDWGEPPHTYLGSYRLEVDMSWTPLELVASRDESKELIKRLMSG